MNVLDRLKEKAAKHRETLTLLEGMIIACQDPQVQLAAAAELHELHARADGKGPTYSNAKDMSELASRHV